MLADKDDESGWKTRPLPGVCRRAHMDIVSQAANCQQRARSHSNLQASEHAALTMFIFSSTLGPYSFLNVPSSEHSAIQTHVKPVCASYQECCVLSCRAPFPRLVAPQVLQRQRL